MPLKPKNTICLWFDKDAHDAARFYAATFPNSAVTPFTKHRVTSQAGLVAHISPRRIPRFRLVLAAEALWVPPHLVRFEK